jgi:uncharacterized protein (DUF1330 family)
MAGYLIANLEVHDRAGYDRYRQQVPAVIAQYGGRYLVRGGAIETVEGKLPLTRFVILEFPSVEVARRFYDSPEYAPLKALRLASAQSDLAFVEGYSG